MSPLMPGSLDVESLLPGNLLDALPDGAYITDRNRQILYWNKAAEKITGWCSPDVVGCSCRDNILVHVDKDGHPLCGHEFCPLHRSMVTGCASTAPLLVFAKSKHGPRVPVEVTVAPIHDAAGEVIGGIEIFRDMSAMMNDLNRARAVQSLSMRFPHPDDDRLDIRTRYVPNDLVGGDFLRIEKIDGDHHAILVADVMGHGIASALYTMQLRSLWEEYRPVLGSPSDFLATLNECLCVLSEGDDHFATAIHVVANASTGDVHYALAGHDRPLATSRDGADIPCPGLHGPCLGLIPHASYPVNHLRLEKACQLLLFTDGATEVVGTRDEELGRDGLAALLAGCARRSAADRLGQIEEQLVRFNRNVRLADDLTLVLLSRPA